MYQLNDDHEVWHTLGLGQGATEALEEMAVAVEGFEAEGSFVLNAFLFCDSEENYIGQVVFMRQEPE